MTEQESMDRLLRQTLTGDTTPTLSPTFDQRLTGRLQPCHLSPKSRAILTGYSLIGTGVSIGAMHQTGLPWFVILLATLFPLGIVAILLHKHIRQALRRKPKRLS